MLVHRVAEQRAVMDLCLLQLRIVEGKQAVLVEPLRRTGRKFALGDAPDEIKFEGAATISETHQEDCMGQCTSERDEIGHQPRLDPCLLILIGGLLMSRAFSAACAILDTARRAFSRRTFLSAADAVPAGCQLAMSMSLKSIPKLRD